MKTHAFSTMGGRLFATEANKAGTEGAQYTDIGDELTKAPGIKFTRNVKEYDMVNNQGWKVKTFLGQSVDDMPLSFIRTDVDGTHDFIKEWTDESVATEKALKDLVFMIPNGDDTFDVNVVTCGIKTSQLVGLDPTIGQEYSVTVSVTGGIKYFKGTVAGDVPTLEAVTQ